MFNKLKHLISVIAVILLASPLLAVETTVLKGVILDVAGQPVANAEVFAYDSPNVKRPGDFISNRSAADGRYRVVLPAGRYWLVARYRQSGARFGPLTPADKHSGDPLRMDLAAGSEQELNFVVADLREAALLNDKKREDYVRVSGRVVDEQGRPIAMAYAMAGRSVNLNEVPEYISGWTDEQGRYTLFVPGGEFYVGAAAAFPPLSADCWSDRKLAAAKKDIDFEIVMKCGKNSN